MHDTLASDANAKVKTAQGNERENASIHEERIPQPAKAGDYDARSTARCKIARNCWFPSCLRLYRKEYSSRYCWRFFWLTLWYTPPIPRFTRLQKPSMVLV